MNEMSSPPAIAFLTPSHEVHITRDVVYATAGIDWTAAAGAARYRLLKLDVYAPADDSAQPRPSIILAFGGAFHRGSKETDEFPDEAGVKSTPVSEYARLFAARGYVCFCIDYRLTQENPDPGVTPVLFPDEPMNKDRVNVVRALFNLPPATDAELAAGIEAATDDMVSAVTFVRSRARFYNVDPARIAIGGFSAGAMIALNAAFLDRVPVAAVVSISGRFSPQTLETCVTGAADEPAVLMFVGDRDLPIIVDGSANTERKLAVVDRRHRFERLNNATHFYPKTTKTADGLDVERAMAAFLYDALRLGPHTSAN